MDPETPKRDPDIQVPGSSPVVELSKPDSSPLKTTDDQASTGIHTFPSSYTELLRNKFVYQPPLTQKFSDPSTTTQVDSQLKQLCKEYSDLTENLIKAVFKSNSFSMSLARERLNKIRDQKTSRSWVWKPNQKKMVPNGTTRLSTLQQPNAYNSSVVISPEKSSKITLERQKTSIFDRYSHVMNQRPTTMESIKVDPSTINHDEFISSNSKKRKLIRADNMIPMLQSKKKPSVSLSDEEEDEISADEVSGDDYHEGIPEVNIDDQILTFINNSDAKDIADLGETSIEKARILCSKRPFTNLYNFQEMDFLTEEELDKQLNKKKGGRRGQQKKDGMKIFEKIAQSIQGYNAIDSLIKKCSSYGHLISSQMKKWGIDVETVKDGELNFMSVDLDEDKNLRIDEDHINIDDDANKVNNHDANLTNSPTRYPKVNDESDLDYEEEEYEESSDDDFESKKSKHKSLSICGRRSTKFQKKNVKFFNQKPRLLSPQVTLKDYQQAGINWLNLLYQNNMSCILADEMGLGKTCQVISFIAYLKQQKHPGPHLIVVPSSTLENWLREFKKFAPDLKIEPYYGSQQERADLREILEETENQYDAIVTTYNLASGNKYDVSFLKNRNFNVVVYDEGHMLKNSLSERFTKLMKIKANFRLLLTGTPLQNNLRELMSLLEFIMPSLFVSKKDDLASVFKQKAKTSDANKDYNPLLAQEAIDRAKTMMKPFILRRRKDQVLKYLPSKHFRIIYCEMNKEQHDIYDKEIQLVMENRRLIKEKLDKGNKLENSLISRSSSKNLTMALRKASLHPLLFRNIYNNKKINSMSDAILDEPEYYENGNKEYIKEDMCVMSDLELHKLCCKYPNTLSKFQLKNNEWMKSGKIEKLVDLLKDIIEIKNEKVLIFSLFTQVLDILEMVLSTLNIKFVRLDGSTQVNDRQPLIDKFYEDEAIHVFILSTKAGGFGINLVCANNVIIFDQSFNPHDDKQAADRAHRVGQTKEVTITTLISKNSIEEKILQLAKNKLALDSHISENNKDDQATLEDKVIDLVENIIDDENKI